MDASMKFGGIVVPIVSPCKENEEMDYDTLERLFDELVHKDIHGMYICGGTGDSERLLPEERRSICSMLVPRLKKENKTAIVHVGQSNLRTAAMLACHAGEQGADAVAAIPPRVSWSSAADYYKTLASCGLPVIIYYIPGLTGIPASYNEIASILEIPGIAGIKVSDWNTFLIRQIKADYPEKSVFTGYDEMLLSGLAAGADGSIGTWANLFPQLYSRLFSLAIRKEWDAANSLSERFNEFLTKNWKYGILGVFEEIMRFRGVECCFRSPRGWPKASLTEEELGSIDYWVKNLDSSSSSY